MRPNLFIFFASLSLVACASEPSVTINGDPFEVTEFSTRLFAGLEGETFIELTFFSDPAPRAIDDELNITVTLELSDLAALSVQSPISLSTSLGDPLLGAFQYGCFCDTSSTTPGLTSGTVTFETLSAQEVRGALELTLSGADSNGIELGEVLIQGDFIAKEAVQ